MQQSSMEFPGSWRPRMHGLIASLMVFCVPLAGHAANRALLIGSGEYRESVFNLSGIDLDIATMHSVVRKLGFKDEDIMVLDKDQVTDGNVRAAFSDFLATGTSRSDTVLIYYSGHGLQVTDKNGDELDGRDEAITLYDLAPAKGGYDGVLIDDELEQLLETLPSSNIIMIVDACHSGTITRGMTESVNLRTQAYGTHSFQAKSLPYRGGRTTTRSVQRGDVQLDSPPRGLVNLSAAQDNEQALATTRGSTFTLALAEALALEGPSATPKSLLDITTALIRDRIDSENLFRPNLTGDENLFNKQLSLTAAGLNRGVNWSDALALLDNVQALEIQTSSDRYQSEDRVELRVNVPRPGFLNVIAVDQDDAMVLLFPNQYSPDNAVRPGWVDLPASPEYDWRAQSPWGENLIVTFFTEENVNLFDTSFQKDQAGKSTVTYALPLLQDLQQAGFGTAQAGPYGLAGGSVSFETCSTLDAC